jgi:uncharacterized membrane protein
MTEDNNSSKQPIKESKKMKNHSSSGIAGAAYFMAFIGAAVFYIQQAATFGAGVIGFLKALVWPAFLVYELLQHIMM